MSGEPTTARGAKSPYEAFLESRGLRPVGVGGHLAESTPMMSVGPGGSRADGATGAILDDLPATLLHSTYSATPGLGGRKFTLVVATISEAVAFARNLSCRDRKVQDDLAHTELARFGDSREVQLESIEFDRRYALQAPPGIDASWLRQLFTPTLIDWFASSAPPGFCFELNEGHFCAAVPGHVDDAAALDAFCAGAKRVAGRIREEAIEGTGHASEAAAIARDDHFERLLGFVRFDEPPPNVAAAVDRYKPVVRRHPWRALRSKELATRLGEEAFVRAYASSRGLDVGDPAGFQVEHARLRLPGAVRHVMTGKLPGAQLHGTIALVDGDVEKAHESSGRYGGAMQTGVFRMIGLGADADRTYDAVVFDAPGTAGAAGLDAAELTSVATTDAAMATAQAYMGAKPGETRSLAQMMSGAMQAWQGLGQRVLADGDTLACVRRSSRDGRSAAELDTLCAQAARVAAHAGTARAGS
jgi:hypothetical protein